MSLKDIKRGRWQRQLHMAGAGMKAGIGWMGGQVKALALPEDRREAAREQLMREQAASWVAELGELKGSVVKIGQILATYGDYCLPAPLAEALHTLEADTAPVAWRAIAPRLAAALAGREAGLIVESTPLAAASLAQVHKARARADHSHLCLKILYPGIEETLDSDLALLANGLRFWLHGEEWQRFRGWLAVIREVLQEELDLEQELQKLQRWALRLQHDARYVVPVALPAFSGPGVLAMSLEAGLVQHDPAVLALPQARRNALGRAMLELLLREVLIWGEMQTDPHPGNYRIRIEADGHDRLILLDFGSVRRISPDLLGPLQRLLLAAWRRDVAGVEQAVLDAGLLSTDTPAVVHEGYAAVLTGLTEPLNYLQRLAEDPASVPSHAVDADGQYCWAAAQLPKRMGKQALQQAVSRHFTFPSADFLLFSRKLAGVYAFIAALDARFDGGEVMAQVVAEMDRG